MLTFSKAGWIWPHKPDGVGDFDVSGLPGQLDHDLARAGVIFMWDDDNRGAFDVSPGGKVEALAGSAELESIGCTFEAHYKGRGLIALIGEVNLIVVPDGGTVDQEWRSGHPGRAEIIGFGLADRSRGQCAKAKASEKCIEENPGADDTAFFTSQTVERIVADKAGGAIQLLHDVVTGIHASGASDTLKLEAITNVDPGWANVHTAPAVNAIGGFGIIGLATWLASKFIVTNDDRVVIGHG